MVYTFALGSQKLWLPRQQPVAANDPNVIGSNPKVIAINNAIEVDLSPRVCQQIQWRPADLGHRRASTSSWALIARGAAGAHLHQLDLQEGRHPGRASSRLSPGTVVTCPRSIVHYVVTEFGYAQLKAKSTWQRTEALIDIAHPGFREESSSPPRSWESGGGRTNFVDNGTRGRPYLYFGIEPERWPESRRQWPWPPGHGFWNVVQASSPIQRIFSAERGHVSDYKHCDICNAALLNYTDDNSPFRRCHHEEARNRRS